MSRDDRVELVLGAMPGPWPNDAELVRDALVMYGAVMDAVPAPGTDAVGINRNRRCAERALTMAEALDERLEVIRTDRAPKRRTR